MGRAWSDADQKRWNSVESATEGQQCEAIEPDDLLLRDVVAGCIVHIVAVLLYRLRLAAPPAHTLGMAIQAATDARSFWDWLAEPMVDLPDQLDAIAETDC